MTTKDFILQNLDQLPEDLWREVLDFILFLRHKQAREDLEDAEDVMDAKAALAEAGLIPLAEVQKTVLERMSNRPRHFLAGAENLSDRAVRRALIAERLRSRHVHHHSLE